jgi:hypothetical protein
MQIIGKICVINACTPIEYTFPPLSLQIVFGITDRFFPQSAQQTTTTIIDLSASKKSEKQGH